MIFLLQLNFSIYFCYKASKEKDESHLLNALLASLSFFCSLGYLLTEITYYIVFGSYCVAFISAILCMRDKLKINLYNIVACIAILIFVQHIADLFAKVDINGRVYTDADLSGVLTLVFLFLAESVYNIAVKNKKKGAFKNVFDSLSLLCIVWFAIKFFISEISLSFLAPRFLMVYNECNIYFIVIVNFILFFKSKSQGGKRNEQKNQEFFSCKHIDGVYLFKCYGNKFNSSR